MFELLRVYANKYKSIDNILNIERANHVPAHNNINAYNIYIHNFFSSFPSQVLTALSSKQTEHATVAIYTGGGRNSISIARRRYLHNNNSSPDDCNILLLLCCSQLLSYFRTPLSGPDELMYSI